MSESRGQPEKSPFTVTSVPVAARRTGTALTIRTFKALLA
jgi:hypothetical protein